MTRAVAIFNPASRSGRAKRELQALQAMVDHALGKRWGAVDWLPTRSANDATTRTRDAVIAGAELVISAGGDGTHSHVVNGFMDEHGEPVNPSARLGIIHLGTGGDFRKSLGIGESLKESLTVVADNRLKKIDIGKITYTIDGGTKQHCFFINIASAGIAGVVDRLVKTTVMRSFGGKAAFAEATIRAFLRYRNRDVSISIDGGPLERRRVCNLVVANGSYFGGGMNIAPHALLNDGMLDSIGLGDFSFFDFFRHGLRLYKGTHLSLAKVWSKQVTSMSMESDTPTYLDIDGEALGKLPASITVLAAKCPLIVGPGALLK